MNRDLREAINWSFWIPVALVAAIIVGMVMYYAVLPTLYNQETKAIRNSNQYITTKQDLMLKWVDEYYDLETEISESSNQQVIDGKRNQQKAIESRVRSEANKLNEEHIPQIVKDFLQEIE